MATTQAPPSGDGRRSLRAEQVAATRQAVVASARRLFGERGYAATSVDDIAAEARVTKGAVYHHFPNKEAVFRAVYAEVEAEATSRAPVSAPGPGATAIDLLVLGVQAYLDATLDPEVQRITLIDGPAVLGPTPLGDLAEDPGHVALRDGLAAAMEAGEVVALDPDALAHLIGGAALQAGLVIARSADPQHVRDRCGEALEAMVRGLARSRPTATRARRPGRTTRV